MGKRGGGKGAATADLCVPPDAANRNIKDVVMVYAPKKQTHVHRGKTDGGGSQTGGGTPDYPPCNTYMNVTLGTLLVGSL